MSDRLHAAGRDTCERRGYEITSPDEPWLPSSLATPTGRASPFVSRSVNELVAVEPLESDEVTPTTLVSRLRNNTSHERFSLFVVGSEADARTVHDVLYDPPLVAGEDRHGRRTFYNGPDRIPLAKGGYAAVRTDASPDDLVWREDGTGDDHSLRLVEGTGKADERARTAEVADSGGQTLAWLDGVDGLACPTTEAFPYSYRRDPDDKRFRLRTREGRVVGVYDGIADMRANAYVPLPMPLVPEHVFSGVSSVRDEWAALVADDARDGADTTPTARVVTAGSF
jgi:hypothetical protein